MTVEGVRLESKWIISGREDLTWFIGSSLVSYAVLALMAAGFPLTPLFIIWLAGIDGPHVVATFTRTYFDNTERRRLGLLLWILLPASFIGPLMVRAGAELFFYAGAITWLHYHIAKQHFGFVMLYKVKAKERERADYLLDRWFLLSSLMLPFVRFLLQTVFAPLYASPAVHVIQLVVLAAYVGLAGVFVLRQCRRWKAGHTINAPKLMVMLAIIPLQWITFTYAAGFGYEGIRRAGIVLGLFHSFQYHRLMWFHNHNRYSDPEVEATAGPAAVLAKRFVYYFGAALGLNLLLNLLPAYTVPGPYVNAALWGLAFTHYILDSKIWRVRGDKQLAAALRLNQPATPASSSAASPLPGRTIAGSAVLVPPR